MRLRAFPRGFFRKYTARHAFHSHSPILTRAVEEFWTVVCVVVQHQALGNRYRVGVSVCFVQSRFSCQSFYEYNFPVCVCVVNGGLGEGRDCCKISLWWEALFSVDESYLCERCNHFIQEKIIELFIEFYTRRYWLIIFLQFFCSTFSVSLDHGIRSDTLRVIVQLFEN